MAGALWAAPLEAGTVDFQVFTDRTHYSAVLLQEGRVQTDADWNEETAGPIAQGQIFKIFKFSFDPQAVLPVVAPGAVTGLAVGAEPNGTLGGDQGFSLHVTPGLALTAFGALIDYGAFDGQGAADIFRLSVDCPILPCASVGNPANLNPRGGTLFLGIIAAPGIRFAGITLEAVTPTDDSGEPTSAVPDWQAAGVTFAAVPEPSTLTLIAAGLCCLAVRSRRAVQLTNRAR